MTNEHQRVLSDLSERLEEALKALQVLKEERDHQNDQLEAAKALSEVTSYPYTWIPVHMEMCVW